MSWRRVVAAILALALVGLGIASELAEPQASRPPAVAAASGPFPHPSRVAVLVLENRSYAQALDRRAAPYLSRLARRSALATRYYAIGHPSLPNYLALTTGSTANIAKDCVGCQSERLSLVNQLDRHGISWRAYFESVGRRPARPATPTGSYVKYYNPFVYTESVQGSAADRSRVVGFGPLRRDLARGTLPRFSWIAPNVRHDGHRHPLAAADAFVRRLVPRVLHALGPRGVLYLTWDEGLLRDGRGVDGARGGGHVPLIAAGGLARRGTGLAVPATHYSLLRTIEANFGLPALGHAGDRSTALLRGLLKPAHGG